MAEIGASFNGSVFHKDFPMVIATNRASAILLPVRLRYDSAGYEAGVTLARNTTDGWFQKYDDGGSSGINTARCFLFEAHPTADFDAATTAGSTMGVGIFGGCVLYYDKLTGLDAAGIVDLGAKQFIDATGVNLLRF